MSTSKFDNQGFLTAIKKLYLDDSAADVYFVVESEDGTSERVPSHKFLLSACSDVFQAMFGGSWKENDVVKIVDASPTVFKEFLRFFYFDRVEITTDHVEEVLRLGQKYLVAECVIALTQLLTDNLTEENVCSVYGHCTFAEQKELKKWCEVVIGLNPTAVFESSGFLECDRQVLSQILKLDTLSCPEIDVFEACVTWLRAASNRETINKKLVQEYLGDSFHNIRFGLMTEEQVNDIFASHGNLFSAAERKEIIRVAKSKRAKSETVSKQPRNSVCNEKSRLKCVRQTQKDHSLYYLGDESTTFSANAPLLLRALVFGEILEKNDTPGEKRPKGEMIDEDMNAKLKIIEFRFADGKVSYSRTIYTDSKVCLNASRNRCNVVELRKPLMIRPGHKYRIFYNLLGPLDERRFCITFGMCTTKVKIQSGITVTFSNDATQNDRIRGLLYGLNFNPI